MPLGFLFTVGSSGGRIVLAKPTITPGAAAGQFIIGTGYDASYTYNLSVDAGTISRAGNVITLSATTATGTVTQTSSKSVSAGPSTTIQRQPITFYSCNCVIVDSYAVGGCCCPGGYNYEDYGVAKYCRKYSCSSCENAPPTGWSKTNGEWTRVT